MALTGFLKLGEGLAVVAGSVQTAQSVFSDPAIENRFKKFAAELRRIAPKADDFLYFSAVMLHAAEASLINSDGSQKLKTNGEPVKAEWEKKGESWKWISNDPSIRPYKNSNGDIFPEEELLKAHSKWQGRPLCVDHRSNSVDAIRGVILDTYYDRMHKRVIGLCALDKISYPDLARKVSTGYSTCVSMGTAVGKAICSDCGNVARTEADFCSHMKSHSCYGEINCDLQPIELSIVVNGADPQAKIRTIIAAANTLNNRISETEREIVRLSDNTEQADKLRELEDNLKQANEKLAELKDLIETTDELPKEIEAHVGPTSGTVSSPSDEIDQSFGLNLPVALAYNNEALLSELKNLKSSMEIRLINMERTLHNTKEEIMSVKDAQLNKEAYFQGGGGVNEPTPGQKKYPVDPLQQELRDHKDKQMVGEPPFPNVGNVDGMHPSPSSVDQSDELERKKMLARAEIDQRSMRRAAALEKAKENLMTLKEAYFQGGGGVNEPTPHKQKYPVDGLQEELRDKEDKQMVGQKPFPDVGNVDGLHPSPLSADQKDELARKKLLQRASLKAKFVRVANPNGSEDAGASGWHVYAKDDTGEKLVFTASVNEISGGKSDALFDVIATKEFGTKMLEKIRAVGIDAANTVYKRGQAAPAVAGPGGAPGGPQDAGGAGATPAMPDMGAPDMAAPAGDDVKPEDDGGKGDPKETALKLAEKVRDMSSDLLEAVKTLSGEQSEMGDLEDGLNALPKAASAALLPLSNMRKELNAALTEGMKKSLSELREHKEELELIASVVDGDNANQEYINTVIEDAFVDSKKAIADGFSLMRAYNKYVRGTAGLISRAEEATSAAISAFANEDENDARRKAKSKSKSKSKSSDDEDMSSADDMNFDLDTENLDANDAAADADSNEAFDDLNLHMEDGDMDMPADGDDMDLDGDMDDLDADDLNDGTMVEMPEGAPLPPGAKAPSGPVMGAHASFDLSTKEGRTAYRAKLAADATGKEETGEIQSAESMPHSDMLDEANGLADGQTQLDTKPSDSLGNIETEPEQQKADLEVARSEPKVRKEAERLNQYIAEGKVNPKDLDTLIAQGLDSEVVKYWRQFYGEAGKEGSEFAKLLTTETFKAKADAEMSTFKVKVSRAYELANDMVRRGLLTDDRGSITAQVDEIMKWNDEAFESMKRVVAKHAPLSLRKEASVPQVGLIGSGDAYSQNASEHTLQDELDRAFSGRKY